MGMPVTVEIADPTVTDEIFETVFGYFAYVDGTFSTYQPESEIMRINRGELTEKDWSALLDFADKHLRGMKIDRRFDQFPPQTDSQLPEPAPAT